MLGEPLSGGSLSPSTRQEMPPAYSLISTTSIKAQHSAHFESQLHYATALEESMRAMHEQDTTSEVGSTERLQMRIDMLERHLRQLDELWSDRRSQIQMALYMVKSELAKMKAVDQIEEHIAATDEDPSRLSWVDSSYFNSACMTIILLNVVLMVWEAGSASTKAPTWVWLLDQVFLSWYSLELALRFAHAGWDYCTRCQLEVVWNWFDIIIVLSGILDQWILPSLVSGYTGAHRRHAVSGFRGLRLLRVMRVARVLRIGKTLWRMDLSFVDNQKFHMLIVVVIGLNAVCIGVELDNPWWGWYWLEHGFLVVYTFELMGRLKHHGLNFFCDPNERAWNILDFVILLLGVVDQWLGPMFWLGERLVFGQAPARSLSKGKLQRGSQLLKVARLLRILRLARLLRAVKPLHKLMCGVLEAMKCLQWVMVLTIITLYAFAITATTLVGHGMAFEDGNVPPEAEGMFTDIPNSMFLLFKVMNDDQSVMDPLITSTTCRLLFVLFMVTANWLILATLTAVVSENMINIARQQEEAERDREIKSKKQAGHARLADLFMRIDTDGSGTIDEVEFQALLSDPVLRDDICDSTGLRVDELKDLFDFLSVDTDKGSMIFYHDFINKLHMEGDLVHERSIFRIEKKVSLVNRRLDEISRRLD